MAAIAVVIVALPFRAAWAESPPPNGPGRQLCFELADGTVITGHTDVEAITIRMEGDNVLKVPVAEITELTVGLNDRPELVQRVEMLVRALDSVTTRASALRELIALGPGVTAVVSRHVASDVAPRRVAVGQILKAYKTWSADHGQAPDAMTRPLERQSTVRADGTVLVGTVTVERFPIASPYGRAGVKLGQVRRIRPAAARAVPVAARKLDQWDVELRNRTRIEGAAISGALRVRTPYGTMVVPFGRIGMAIFARDGKSVRVQCRNFDRIIGTLEPKATLSLRTDTDRMDLSAEKIAVVLYGPATLALGNGVTMKLVRISAGRFTIGSPRTAKGRHESEDPRRRVTISRPFYMGATEVTQAQWKAVMNTQPWDGQTSAKTGADHPAGYISWHDATAFCTALSKKTGRTIRLPTEAEWECACRAGTTTAYSFGDDSSKLGDYAWYHGNAEGKGDKSAHSVGTKKPNAWGLYDMHGNVWEWCADWANTRDSEGLATKKCRVLRGGAWSHDHVSCRAAYGGMNVPASRCNFIGFRVVVGAASGVGSTVPVSGGG